jgi:hypothetical protein
MAAYQRVLEFWWPTGWPVITADSATEIFSLSQARNNAVAQAKTDVVVICDADTIPDMSNIKAAVADPVGVCWPFTIYRVLAPEHIEVPFKKLAEVPWLYQWGGDGANGVGGCLITTTGEYWRLGGQPPEFCTDEQTQIMTSTGWRHYTDVNVGDDVLTLNHHTGLSEWNPVQRINIFSGVHEMLSIESKTHSSLTTLDHRWPVIRHWNVKQVRKKAFQRSRRDWATSGDFRQDDRVPVATHCANLPDQPKYVDALVEVIAWFWTEGHAERTSRGVTISQSVTVNPTNCALIEAALTRAFGSASSPRSRGSHSPVDIPRWTTSVAHHGKTRIFNLNAEAGELIRSLAPDKVPTHDFIRSLTQAQLVLFIETSMLGDGHSRIRSYERILGQKNPAAAEAFQFACILAGYATSSATRPAMPKYGYGMTVMSIRQQRHFKLSKGTHKRIDYDGLVWCPTTRNHTWLARRNGKVYFTGNCGWGHEDTAFTFIVETLSTLRRLPGNIYTFEHNTSTAAGYTGAKADSPGWDRNYAQNEALMAPYRRARHRAWLMREIIKERTGKDPLGDEPNLGDPELVKALTGRYKP